MSANGDCLPQGHEKSSRARRQDLPALFSETGAFYFMQTKAFLDEKTRFCGRVGSILVSKVESLDIDTFEDLAMANQLAAEWDRKNYTNENKQQ